MAKKPKLGFGYWIVDIPPESQPEPRKTLKAAVKAAKKWEEKRGRPLLGIIKGSWQERWRK